MYDIGKRVYYRYGKMWKVGRIVGRDKDSGEWVVSGDGNQEFLCKESQLQPLANAVAVANITGPPAAAKKKGRASYRAVLGELDKTALSMKILTRMN